MTEMSDKNGPYHLWSRVTFTPRPIYMTLNTNYLACNTETYSVAGPDREYFSGYESNGSKRGDLKFRRNLPIFRRLLFTKNHGDPCDSPQQAQGLKGRVGPNLTDSAILA